MAEQVSYGRLDDNIVYAEEIPPREARYQAPSKPLHPRVNAALKKSGFEQIYTHQAQALDRFREGKDLTVVTGTNSGKSLSYVLPTLELAATEPLARALYIFPTKALAQDQAAKLAVLGGELDLRVATYDGDTPANQRSSIRKMAHVVVTNPDMLHVGILPTNDLWSKFFKALRLIVIDEVHAYRGVFGSHVGNVIRRLLRIAEWHHARPQIVCCSATIGNPLELTERITGRKSTLIDDDGSPKGKRSVIFMNPPLIDDINRLSGNITAAEAMGTLVEAGVRTLTFNRSRVGTELVLKYVRQRLDPALRPMVESYRAGYTPTERRAIEQAVHRGDIMGLSATNALELGVDIGSLDAVVINGYPGSISAFWQQAGRAGRGTRDGMALFIPGDNPLEQYLADNPQTVLEGRNEAVSVDPENPNILGPQLLCAAHERPLSPSELPRFGDGALDVAEKLDREGKLAFRSGMFFYPSFEPPSLSVSIRGSGTDLVRLLVGGEDLGVMEFGRALMNAHQGAVYLHRGDPFLVTALDLERKEAHLVPFEGNFYTQPMVQSLVEPGLPMKSIDGGPYAAHLASVRVTDTVIGFRRKSFDGESILSVEDLELPPQTFDTVGIRLDLPELREEDDMDEQIGSIHGFEHMLGSMAPIFLGCDRNDLGTAWFATFFDTMAPAIFLFDRTPGGVGLSEKAFERLESILRAGEERLRNCQCESGCPSCLFMFGCEVNNEALRKLATRLLIQRVRANLTGNLGLA